MKKYLLVIALLSFMIVTGCGVKNNEVTDNNNQSDVNPDPSANVTYRTMTCTKKDENMGVGDGTKYIIKHDGQNVQSITMKLDYHMTNDEDKEVFDQNKNLFTDLADKMKDIAGVTTNIVEDTVDMFQADLTLALDKMSDTDIANFDDFKLSKDLEEQKRLFEEKGFTCN